MCRLGAIDTEIADYLDISRATLHRWRVVHEGLAEAMIIGKDHADRRVEDALFRNAVGYTHEVEKVFNVNGVLIHESFNEHVLPNSTSQIFWLKNRKSKEWRQAPVADDDSELAQSLNISIEVAEPVKDVKVTKGTAK